MTTSVVHYDDILEYNAHNLYGISKAIMKNIALNLALNNMPFILTHSTFSGSGAHTAHWIGDNVATYDWCIYNNTYSRSSELKQRSNLKI
jgi:alpha-D-xyloside xylohydrolase